MNKVVTVLTTCFLLVGLINIANSSPLTEIVTEIKKVKRSCASAGDRTLKAIKQAQDLDTTAKDLLKKIDSYSGYNEAKSELRKVKSNVYHYLRGARSFRNEMSWCDSFDVYTFMNAEDAYKKYKSLVKKVQRAQNEYSKFTHYYSDAIDNYNKAIKLIKK